MREEFSKLLENGNSVTLDEILGFEQRMTSDGVYGDNFLPKDIVSGHQRYDYDAVAYQE